MRALVVEWNLDTAQARAAALRDAGHEAAIELVPGAEFTAEADLLSALSP